MDLIVSRQKQYTLLNLLVTTKFSFVHPFKNETNQTRTPLNANKPAVLLEFICIIYWPAPFFNHIPVLTIQVFLHHESNQPESDKNNGR